MKKIFLLLFILHGLTYCNSQETEVIQKIEVSTFKEHIKNKEVQLIDVRTPKEYKQGAIKNAILMNFYEDNFEEQLLTLNKEKPVYLYCHSGGRSGKASKKLFHLGFKKIYDLKGGYKAWQKTK